LLGVERAFDKVAKTDASHYCSISSLPPTNSAGRPITRTLRINKKFALAYLGWAKNPFDPTE